MKKTIAMAAAMLISFSAVSMNVFAEETESTQVYVTITDNNKAFALNQEPITVTDIDEDGKLTINDALYIAHEEKFEGGAEAGYKTTVAQWGLSLAMLWGIDNKGSYGYYVNDGYSTGLTDEIKDGDYIEAFVYPDPQNYNYFYSFFDSKNTDEKEPDSEIDLTLAYYTFGADGTLVTNKLEGAKITINGKETDFVTDADGKVTVKLTEAGKNVISAVSDSVDIVPPSYLVNVKGEAVTTSTETTSSTTSETTTSTTATDKVTAKTSVKTTTKVAVTTKSKSDAPKDGDKGAGVAVFGIITAVATAFALRRKNEE